MDQNQAILSIEELSKSYKQGQDSLEILKGLNFSIFPGETAAIIGESEVENPLFCHLLLAWIIPALER